MRRTKTTTFCSMVCNYSVQENHNVTNAKGNRISLAITITQA